MYNPINITHPWAHYSKKLAERIVHPLYAGSFCDDEIDFDSRLIVISESLTESVLIFYWIVNENNGMITQVRYQVFGASALIGVLEASSQLLVGKNYVQAKRISADLIDRELRDKNNERAFPPEASTHFALILKAIEKGAAQCLDIPFDEIYTPLSEETSFQEKGYEGWTLLSKKRKN